MTNKKKLIFIHIAVFILIFSLFSEFTKAFWLPLDKGCFQILNSFIAKNTFFQNFWAMANHHWADTLEDICFIMFFTWIVKDTPKEGRRRKLAECLFVLFFSALIHLTFNELLFREILHIRRLSPTLVLDSFTDLSEKVTWLKVKVRSPKSYPGDHATVAILFVAGFIFLARKNLKILCCAVSYGIFLILPRLIAGAHWITDVLFGSIFIVLIPYTWAFCTPLANIAISKLENGINAIKPKKKQATPSV